MDRAGVRVHALHRATAVLSRGYRVWGATRVSLYLRHQFVTAREAELIRIRMPDTYLNARAYINLFKTRARE